MNCEHDDVSWYAADAKRKALNEEAWRCLGCSEWLGFRPDLDRSHTETKTSAILMDFHESKLIYISNGTMGEIVAANVANRCCAENRYDQDTILRYILDDPNMDPDSTFWQTLAERHLMGAEPIRKEQEAIPF